MTPPEAVVVSAEAPTQDADLAVRALIWTVVVAIAVVALGAALLVLRGLLSVFADALVLLVLALVSWSGVLTLRVFRLERALRAKGDSGKTL